MNKLIRESKPIPKMKKKKKGKEPLVTQHKEFLHLLSNTKNKKRRNGLIDVAENKEIKAISECIHNILLGNVPVTKKQIEHLRKYRHILRTLASRCSSLKKKRKILKQKGGYLAFHEWLCPVLEVGKFVISRYPKALSSTAAWARKKNW